MLEGSVEPASEWWAELGGLADPAEQVDDAAWRARLLKLARAWQAHKNKTPRDIAAKIADAFELPSARERFAAIDAALLTKEGTIRKNLPESPALAEAGEFLVLLHEQVAQHDAHLEHQRMVRL